MTYQEQEIRAQYDAETITVYQAYGPHIALPAMEAQTFVAPFKMERMTWIKPSYLWMMYRSGWASKPGQEHVLAIRIQRKGWEWALRHACLSHFDGRYHASQEAWKETLQNSPVRIQWDPEKDLHLQNLSYRSIQVGLKAEAVDRYVKEWIVGIEDISNTCHEIQALIKAGNAERARMMLPDESIYPMSDDIRAIIHAS